MVVAAIILLLPSFARASTVPDGFYGVNPGDLFRLPETQWDAHLSSIAGDGVQVVRLGAWWSDLEPGAPVGGRHTYSWGDVDKQVAALARHNLQWEPLLCFSATWGSNISGDYNGSPDGTGNFAAFGAALAKRYGPDGSFWQEHPELPALPVSSYEVWNEENAQVYWHPGDAASYADLYAATHEAIHQVDGSARVVVGGLAADDSSTVQDPAAFLRGMYAHRPDLKGSVDAVALHPYASTPQRVYAKLAAFRQDLDSIAGPGVPIELTEIGWTTTDVSESTRAQYLGEVASTLARTDCGVDRVTAYAWLGPEQSASDREQWFGIANRDGSNKPSAAAYGASIRRIRGLSGAAPTDTVHLCSGSAAGSRSASSAASVRHAAKHLKLRVTVRRHPGHAGRLLINARCSTGCRLSVQVVAPRSARAAARARAASFAPLASARTARHQTLTVNVAKRVRSGVRRITVRVTAISARGQRATKVRVVTLRQTGATATQSAAAYVAA